MEAIYLNQAAYVVYGRYRARKEPTEEMSLVLRLRLNQRAELTVEQAFGGIEAFQTYLNENEGWMFQQQEKKYLNTKWVTYPTSIILLSGNVKLVLSKPIIAYEEKDLYYYNRIITILRPNRDDRTDALAGNEIKEPIEIEPDMRDSRLIKQVEQPTKASATASLTAITVPSKPVQAVAEKTASRVPTTPPQPSSSDDRQRFLISPTCPKCSTILTPGRGIFCQACGVRLPADVGVHPEIVVAIKKSDYEKLATYLKQAVNAAWTRLMKGRKVDKTLYSLGQNLFLIVVADEVRTSTLAQEEELNDILTETGIGRVTSDLYEICKARKMLNNKQNQASD